MKAIILAAGFGERLRPLSEVIAKPAVPFLNRPLLHYALETCAKAGIAKIGINLHHRPETVRAAAKAWEGAPLEIHFNLEKQILGTGGALYAFQDWAEESPLLLLNGDTLAAFSALDIFACRQAANADAALLTRANPDPRQYSGVIVDERGRVRQIAGAPSGSLPAGKVMMFAGAHALAPGFIRRYAPARACDINREIYPPLIEAGRLPATLQMKNPVWADLGTRERFLNATGAALKAIIEKQWPFALARGSRLIKTHTGGMLLLDESASVRIETVKVEGFAVIGPRCVISGEAVLENSVLLAGAKLGRGAKISGSVIGPDLLLKPGTEVRDALRV